LNPEFKFIHILTKPSRSPFWRRWNGCAWIATAVRRAVRHQRQYRSCGIVTTAACPAFAYRAQEDATIVGQLIALGAVPLGKPILISLPPA
jgi:allophanate hydrolase